MIITMFAAALAAAAPAAPAPPADAHPQHQSMPGHQQHGDMAKMKDCCCHEMMEKMHSGHGMQDHQEHGGN